ncbi:MAG: hypothetical protein WDM86_17470 [Rhizomicrobium sp.]
MTKKWTHTAAFESFGVRPWNTRWSWSARSDDGKIVVATLWQDQFSRRDNRLIYARPGFTLGERKRPGFSEWVENLAWAEDHCGGRFHVIAAIPKDKNADPRSIAECFPTKTVMRIVEFDRQTGAFVAEQEAREI